MSFQATHWVQYEYVEVPYQQVQLPSVIDFMLSLSFSLSLLSTMVAFFFSQVYGAKKEGRPPRAPVAGGSQPPSRTFY